jgi:hypothetical protein
VNPLTRGEELFPMADLNPTWWKGNSKVSAATATDAKLKTLYGELERYLDVYSKKKAAHDKAPGDARLKKDAHDAMPPIKSTCTKLLAEKTVPENVKKIVKDLEKKWEMDEKVLK